MLKLKNYVSRYNYFLYCFTYSLQRIAFLLNPLVLRGFVDYSVSRDLDGMKRYGLYALLLFIGTQIIMYFFDIAQDKSNSEAVATVYETLDYNLDHYDMKKTSIEKERIVKEVSHNLSLIEPFFIDAPIRSVFSLIVIIVISIIMFQLSPILSLVMIVAIPLGVLASYKTGDMVSTYSDESIENLNEIKNYCFDKYDVIKSERLLEFKQFTNFKFFIHKYEKNQQKQYRYNSFVNNFLIYFILNGVILALQLVAGYLVYTGSISIGTFFATEIYISQFWTPVEFLFDIRKQYLSSKPAIFSFIDFMNITETEINNDQIETISLENFVSLDKNSSPLHAPLNVTFDNKHVYILKGQNGIGKTTIIESIMGYTDRFSGDIRINNNMMKKSYQDLVYVSADYHISSLGTLRDHEHDSSGQQKLAQLTLALKTDKSVYIIDEPTNYLDIENRDTVLQSIEQLSDHHKIVIIITHDPFIIDTLTNTKIIDIQ